MLGKTKVETTEKARVRLQPQNNKWYRHVALVQMIVFAVIHLVLGMYFAFVSSEYANHPGFAAKIDEHRILDQICAIVCFVLFAVGLRCFYGLLKQKKISVLYYVYMAVSAVLPILYIAMSGNYITDAMVGILEEGYPEFFEGDETGWITFWVGVEFGIWPNGGEITYESELVLDYLSRIGEEAGAVVALDDFNLSGLLGAFRADMYVWNRFELYSIINAVATAVFVVCGIFFLPLKKSKLFKK